MLSAKVYIKVQGISHSCMDNFVHTLHDQLQNTGQKIVILDYWVHGKKSRHTWELVYVENVAIETRT